MSEDESSVLFSLKELMTIEEDRIRTEEDDRQRASQALETAQVEAKRAAQEAEEARIRADDERRRLDEQGRREEAARLEAIQHGEVERARVEAEGKARMAAMSAQQTHERQLAVLHSDDTKKRLRKMVIGAVATLVIGGGLGGYFWYQSAQESAKALAVKEAEAERQAAELAKQKRQFEAQQKEIAALQDKLMAAADPAEIKRIRAELQAAQKRGAKLRPGVRRPGGKGKGKPKAAPKCQPGDPLCAGDM